MYESFYNLSAAPFQLMPDPRFLFPRQGHKRALSYLLYGLQRREGFVVITGDVGIGKTLLVQALIDEIGGRNLSVVRVAMANLDADGVLPMVASAFGLPFESRSKVGLLDELVAKVLPSYNRGALLIVDEAQTCTPAALEELRVISNLQAGGQALLQVFLVGQSELRRTLAQRSMEQLRQRVITSYHLRPLYLDEVREYVQHRLTASGWRSNPELAAGIYPRVYDWSRGVPRRINLLMDRLLLYGYLEELHALDESDVQIVIDELDAEQQDDLADMKSDAAAAPAWSSEDSDALLGRIAQLENAFTSAVGDDRARQLLDKHETSAQHKALVAMDLRIARLESLLSDRTALRELREPGQHLDAPTSTGNGKATVPEEMATPEQEAQQPHNEQMNGGAQAEDQDERDEQSAASNGMAGTEHGFRRYAEDVPGDPESLDIPVPKWRLFSRRR